MNYKLMLFKKIALMLVAIVALGWLVMCLWNWIVPSLFVGAHAIDYLRAIGLLVLCRILFGGFHGHGGWHHFRHMQRWEKMTEEEKEKFQQGMGFRTRHRN